MDWLIAVILVLGILTLFGWKGIEAIGRLLGLIGALFILLIAWIALNVIFNKDDLIIIGSLIGVIFIGAILYGIFNAEQELRENPEEKERIRKQVLEEARKKLKDK